jgi:hypothetical protein
MKDTILKWANEMVQNYPWLTVKFEYNQRFGTFLVDFVYSIEYQNNEDFHRDALGFNDKMNEFYCDDAPLFTDNGKLFTLSDSAIIISSHTYFDCGEISSFFRLQEAFNWSTASAATTVLSECVNSLTNDSIMFDIAA